MMESESADRWINSWIILNWSKRMILGKDENEN